MENEIDITFDIIVKVKLEDYDIRIEQEGKTVDILMESDRIIGSLSKEDLAKLTAAINAVNDHVNRGTS